MSDGKTEVGGDSKPPAGAKHGRPSLLGDLSGILRRRSSAKDTGGYTGVFSYAAEYHAFFVALGVAYAGDPAQVQAVVAYALGRGGAKKKLGDDAHLKDLADEPAYALAGAVVGKALRGMGHLPLPILT